MKNITTAEALKKQVKIKQRELEEHINRYASEYQNFLYELLLTYRITGEVKRISDGIRGELRVHKRIDKFVFYEPYVIVFEPYEPHVPKQEIYNAVTVVTDFEKILK